MGCHTACGLQHNGIYVRTIILVPITLAGRSDFKWDRYNCVRFAVGPLYSTLTARAEDVSASVAVSLPTVIIFSTPT